jgi:hypothetical protein
MPDLDLQFVGLCIDAHARELYLGMYSTNAVDFYKLRFMEGFALLQ